MCCSCVAFVSVVVLCFFFSSRRRRTRCALVTGVQTCALPIYGYQPIEREWRVTRSVIEVLAETRHPLLITTKSDRLLRDIDLLATMARDDLVGVAISVTTLDPKLARILEPRAPHPRRRLAAIRKLIDAGVPTQINISPIIPAITDHEIEAIMAAAAQAGAIRASYILLRLPFEVAPLFRAWLSAHYHDRANQVMPMVQDIPGGRAPRPEERSGGNEGV